jgi:hypothetical protein
MTSMSGGVSSALLGADSAQGDHDRSTPELEASLLARRSGVASSRAAAAPSAIALPVSDNLGSAAAAQHGPSGSESGGRGGVSDLGGGEQPTAEASAASTSGSPSARTRNVALCARRPRDARWNNGD